MDAKTSIKSASDQCPEKNISDKHMCKIHKQTQLFKYWLKGWTKCTVNANRACLWRQLWQTMVCWVKGCRRGRRQSIIMTECRKTHLKIKKSLPQRALITFSCKDAGCQRTPQRWQARWWRPAAGWTTRWGRCPAGYTPNCQKGWRRAPSWSQEADEVYQIVNIRGQRRCSKWPLSFVRKRTSSR